MNTRIVYDTISFTSTFEFSNKIIQENLSQFIQSTEEIRITEWIESLLNCILKETNYEAINLVIDGCDSYEVKLIEETLNEDKFNSISLTFENIIDEEKLAQKTKLIDKFFYALATSDNEILRENFNIHQQNINNCNSQIIELPVLATMSSGKSTFLNAIIGHDLLHEDQRSTTATTCTIAVNEEKTEFKVSAESDGKIITNKEGESIKDFLEKWNKEANTNPNIKLKLEGPVNDLDSSHFQLNFIDTPGPNASENTSHKIQTYEYLKGKGNLPLVMYVIDLENIDSNDDKNTFEEIRDILKKNKQAGERIIFILNKIDREDIDKKSIEDCIADLKRDLMDRYEIKNPLIFPISSMYAKLAQLNSEDLGRKAKSSLIDFQNNFIPDPNDNHLGYQLVENAPLSLKQKEILYQRIAQDKQVDVVYSGLAAIKLYIEDYIKNHHKKNQYKDLSNIFKGICKDILQMIELKKNEIEIRSTQSKEEIERQEKIDTEKIDADRNKLIEELNIQKPKIDVEGDSAKYFERLDGLKTKMLGLEKIEKSKAINLYDSFMKEVNNILMGFTSEISTNSERVLSDYFNSLKQVSKRYYDNNIENVRISSFQANMSNSINTINLDEYTSIIYHEEVKEVKSSSWFKRLFNMKDEIVTKREEHLVDFREIYKNKFLPITKQMKNSQSDYFKSVNRQSSDIKDIFIKNINSFSESSKKRIFKSKNITISDLELNNKLEIKKLENLAKTLSKYTDEKI